MLGIAAHIVAFGACVAVSSACSSSKEPDIDRCAGITCAIKGETCTDGTCQCGTAATCEGILTVDACDADHNYCNCGGWNPCTGTQVCNGGACECCANIQVSGISGTYSYLNKKYSLNGIYQTKAQYINGNDEIYWSGSRWSIDHYSHRGEPWVYHKTCASDCPNQCSREWRDRDKSYAINTNIKVECEAP